MNLATPQPTFPVRRVEGCLPRSVVTRDAPETAPVTVPNRWWPAPADLSLIDQLHTEDDQPVDNLPSSKQQRLLVDTLYNSWDHPDFGERFLADVNIGMFAAVREPPLVPDMFLSVNVQVATDWWAKKHRSYFFWEFGKPPDVVIEIVSNQEGCEDTHKLQDYARLGIRYYVIFDPEQQLSETVLRSYELRGTKYVKQKKPWFPTVDLGLTLWTGTFEKMETVWLRWCDKDGNLMPAGRESTQQQRHRADLQQQRADREQQRAEQERREKERALSQVEQERQRAEQERQRAEQERHEKEMALCQVEQERQRAEQERLQKERLLAKLRSLGIELSE